MQYIIEDEIIGLAKTNIPDIEFIQQLEDGVENARFIYPYSNERHLQSINNADERHFTVWNKKLTIIEGFIILAGMEDPNLSLEFRRIVIASKGNGYGRRCLKLVKRYCFETLVRHRLWLDVFENNQRAIQLYQSEGFRHEGKLRDAIRTDAGYKDLIIMSMLKSEYRSNSLITST